MKCCERHRLSAKLSSTCTMPSTCWLIYLYYDAVYLYLRTVNQTLAEGYSDYRDGRLIRNKTVGQRFVGECSSEIMIINMNSRTTVSSVRHCPIQCLYRKTISDKYFCVVRLFEYPVSVGGIPVTVTRESHPRPRPSHFQERCMMTRIKSCTGDTSSKITNCAGGRHNMPPPPTNWPLIFWAWKWCPSHEWCGLPLCQF